jgi:hypothetical protein
LLRNCVTNEKRLRRGGELFHFISSACSRFAYSPSSTAATADAQDKKAQEWARRAARLWQLKHRAKNPTPNDNAIAGQSEAKSTIDGR